MLTIAESTRATLKLDSMSSRAMEQWVSEAQKVGNGDVEPCGPAFPENVAVALAQASQQLVPFLMRAKKQGDFES
jgi:hypothetical protein